MVTAYTGKYWLHLSDLENQTISLIAIGRIFLHARSAHFTQVNWQALQTIYTKLNSNIFLELIPCLVVTYLWLLIQKWLEDIKYHRRIVFQFYTMLPTVCLAFNFGTKLGEHQSVQVAIFTPQQWRSVSEFRHTSSKSYNIYDPTETTLETSFILTVYMHYKFWILMPISDFDYTY